MNPTRKGNGVKAIKTAFVETLVKRGWVIEYHRFDCHFEFPGASSLPFVVEWETGNISSSHRAVNRIALAIAEGRISGGVLIVPSSAMYQYLTDRVGNFGELQDYLPLWQMWSGMTAFANGYLGIVVVEYDGLDPRVPVMQKGTDGRALL